MNTCLIGKKLGLLMDSSDNISYDNLVKMMIFLKYKGLNQFQYQKKDNPEATYFCFIDNKHYTWKEIRKVAISNGFVAWLASVNEAQ